MAAHRTLREGFVAGVVGATSVAVWFFVVDLIAGRPLHTPSVLGEAVMNVFGPNRGEGPLEHVMLYTVFHYAAFFIVGIIAAALIQASEKEPSVLAGFLILFVAFEVGFYGLTVMLSKSILGSIAWYQIGAANLVAAFLMGRYLLHEHPGIVSRLDQALKDGEWGTR